MPPRTPLDDDGRPEIRAFNAARLSDRAIDELVGLCRMAAADGQLSAAEVDCLYSWATANRAAASRWPANRIYERLRDALKDGHLDQEETADLLSLCREISGGTVPVEERIVSYSTSLPLTRPAPMIRFDGQQFCFTGKFVYGTRKRCEEVIAGRGGQAQSAPTQKTDYLVIGAIGSTDWIHSSFGRKIEAAVSLREQGHGIAIIAEEHWTSFIAQ